ncbi:Nucleophosmin, partial [Plecturocebus cupreus]
MEPFVCSMLLRGNSGHYGIEIKHSNHHFGQPDTEILDGILMAGDFKHTWPQSGGFPPGASQQRRQHPGISPEADFTQGNYMSLEVPPGHRINSDGQKQQHFLELKFGNAQNAPASAVIIKKVSLGAGAKDESHIVEADTVNYEGSSIKVTLATLKISVQPTVYLESNLLLEMVASFHRKKVKLAADEDDEDDDDDEDEETEEKVPDKNPSKNRKKKKKTPKTPKGPNSMEDIKAITQGRIEKGGSLPKVEAKFIIYVKNCFRLTDREAIQDLW